MAIIWNKIIPRWGGDTIEPPEAKKDTGYIAGDKPPAKWENWLRKGTYEALEETRTVVEGIDSQLAQKPSMTTGDITFYVSTSGNDNNDGLTAGTALRNIQTAISRIPLVLRHPVNINIASGTYSEDVKILGFLGEEILKLNGGADLNASANFVVNSVSINNCLNRVDIVGIRAITTTQPAFFAVSTMHARFTSCSAISSSSAFAGIQANVGTMAIVSNCLTSNRSSGILASGGIIASLNNAGTGNQIGLRADFVGTLGKQGTQPTGTANEFIESGGVIR